MTEQEFLNAFVEKFSTENPKIKILQNNCRAKKNCPDLKYQDGDEIWMIEAKISSNDDKYNAVHKLFGELLKMTGFSNEGETMKYGLLLDNEEFFRSHFATIDAEKFLQFGKIVPVSKVFVYENGEIKSLSWSDFIQ